MEEFDKEAYNGLHVDFTLNYHKLYEIVITKDAYNKGTKNFVCLKYAATSNDIFRAINKADVKYYIKKFVKLDEIDGYIYEFKRVDGNSITQTDLDKLKKGGKIKIKGHLN
jgi:hypothetical protein